MLEVIAALITGALFALTGWLGVLLSESLYGKLTPETNGPAAIVVPAWAFIAVAGALGVLVGIHDEPPVRTGLLLVAVLALTVCAATDCRAGMIPDLFSLAPLLLVLAVSGLEHDWAPAFGAAFAFVPFAVLALISQGHGMGWGDVKLATLGGALVGMVGITLAVTLASLVAYAVGRTRGRGSEPIAFGPYLAVSIGAALAAGSIS